jgi:hypothetical protein
MALITSRGIVSKEISVPIVSWVTFRSRSDKGVGDVRNKVCTLFEIDRNTSLSATIRSQRQLPLTIDHCDICISMNLKMEEGAS